MIKLIDIEEKKVYKELHGKRFFKLYDGKVVCSYFEYRLKNNVNLQELEIIANVKDLANTIVKEVKTIISVIDLDKVEITQNDVTITLDDVDIQELIEKLECRKECPF